MDVAGRKIELIEWLARLRDEKLFGQVEDLRKASSLEAYKRRSPRNTAQLKVKLARSEKAIEDGKVNPQDQVESYLRSKFTK